MTTGGNGELGEAKLKLSTDSGPLDGGMGKARKSVGVALTAMGAAVVGFAALSIKSFADTGDQIQKMALRTGFSTEALSELRFAAEQSGTTLEGLEVGIRRMASTIDDAKQGLSTAVYAFDQLGLRVEDLEGMSPEQAFETLALAIADVPDELTKAALATDIFGRSGTQLLPLLADGSEGIERLRQEARDLGIVFDQDAANAAAEFKDNMNSLSKSFDSVKFGIAQALLPALKPLIEGLTEIVVNVKDWMERNPELARTLTVVVVALGAVSLAMGTVLLLLPPLIAGAAALGISLSVALLGIPALIAGIVAAITFLIIKWDEVVEFMKGIGGWILLAFGPIGLAAKLLIDNWEAVVGALRSVFNFVMGFVEDIVDAVNVVIRAMNKVGQVFGKTIDEIELDLPRWETANKRIATSADETEKAVGKSLEDMGAHYITYTDKVEALSQEHADFLIRDAERTRSEIEKIEAQAIADGEERALQEIAQREAYYENLRIQRWQDVEDYLAAEAAKYAARFVDGDYGSSGIFAQPGTPAYEALQEYFGNENVGPGSQHDRDTYGRTANSAGNYPGAPGPIPNISGSDPADQPVSVTVNINGRQAGVAIAEVAVSDGGALPSD